ncbi:MAG: carbamoyl-phosphate synthase large subunit [Bdellovibrionales bacterium]|nr:carbamoyl-phosphate synthase large subunit [Bdellovibrionales bacterium]
MPKRKELKKILLIGSGPIVIGQACEFDYSGTQAIKALKEEGIEVVLVNSNPATIMTDPEFADRTYIEPISPSFLASVIEKERPDAVLPTMGGQTALNCALALAEEGILEKFGCELIGAKPDSIRMAEDRELFRKAMEDIGLPSAESVLVSDLKHVDQAIEKLGFPIILRPSRTLGGTGGGIAYDPIDLKRKVSLGLKLSPVHEVLLERSLLGWKEIELEVMRDLNDNVVIVCGIENFDPMGVHTGDSITVAPIQTLTDKEYQTLRDAAIAIMRKIGVDTGGSNVQFAINPENGEFVVIEMNPRVSRSSALASKATGFPIAKIAAKLAIGYSLDELQNDITKETPACFEPALDYVVVKIPRFAFEKFPLAEPILGTQMRSVGEAMAFGRTFSEAMQKALASLEDDSFGFDKEDKFSDLGDQELLDQVAIATPKRVWQVGESLRRGISLDLVAERSGIDRWFLHQILEIVNAESVVRERQAQSLGTEEWVYLKQLGFSDVRLAKLFGTKEEKIRELRQSRGVRPTFRLVDTCAAEFQAFTPYLYSSYDRLLSDAPASNREKIIILGSGPNRIGQGIEFDYCCVHASLALRELGFESVMVNCNPETVSTDFDISDRLYFEPLTLESVLEIVEREKPIGVIVQFGGQTPLRLAQGLAANGVPIIGTSVDSIDRAEDRELFGGLVRSLKLQQPPFCTVRSVGEAASKAKELGFPLMIRPSFVLGGRSMRIVFSESELTQYLQESVDVSHERPVLIDRFLQNAVEVDLDAVSDGKRVVIAGVLEHIERAGVHSGDSSCCLPPQSLNDDLVAEMKRQAEILAKELKVRGLMNIQFAITPDREIYILEVNPRASRTVPFVSKATGVPWAKVAAKVMAGKTLDELKVEEVVPRGFFSVKACVFPFSKFQGIDTILGPEMKSTGEVMGIDRSFSGAFFRSQVAAGIDLPKQGKVFLSVRDDDKADVVEVAQNLLGAGYSLVATSGTAEVLKEHGLAVETVHKVREGSPHVVDKLGGGEIQLVVNTPEGHGPMLDSKSIRLVSNELGIPTYTTMPAALAAALALKEGMIAVSESPTVMALQDYQRLREAEPELRSVG